MRRTYDNQSLSESGDRIDILLEMESHFNNRDGRYFRDLLNHKDNVIRTRAICILAEIGGREAVKYLSDVLKNDKDLLVRHEAAFSLGQLGFAKAIGALSDAVTSDPSLFVRHEAAIGLGVIGSEEGKEALNKALGDESEEVRESAKIALANIDYVARMKRYNKFCKMTGG
jgi:deoxyhypusine monooxygenase